MSQGRWPFSKRWSKVLRLLLSAMTLLESGSWGCSERDDKVMIQEFVQAQVLMEGTESVWVLAAKEW